MPSNTSSNVLKKVAVVGCGYWGKNLVRNFHQLGALSLVCTRSENGKRVARETASGVEIVADFSDALRRNDLTGIVLATPAETHFELTMKALEAEKDVFVEKPMAPHVREAREMTDFAAVQDRILMVGHILEYHPAVSALKQLLVEKAFGTVRHLSSTRLNLGKIRSEENVLWSFAPHDVTLLLRLAGSLPEEVSCCGSTGLTDGVPDAVTAFFRFPDGLTARITVDWLFPVKERRLVVAGEKGMAVFDDVAEKKLVVYRHRIEKEPAGLVGRAGEAEVIDLPAREPLRGECEHFLECVATRRRPISDGESAVAILRVLDACQRSMDANGRPVTLAKDFEAVAG